MSAHNELCLKEIKLTDGVKYFGFTEDEDFVAPEDSGSEVAEE